MFDWKAAASVWVKMTFCFILIIVGFFPHVWLLHNGYPILSLIYLVVAFSTGVAIMAGITATDDYSND